MEAVASLVSSAGIAVTCKRCPGAGLPVLSEGTAAVIDALAGAGLLLREERYAHKYPYDWRTKQPTIFRATDQARPACCG